MNKIVNCLTISDRNQERQNDDDDADEETDDEMHPTKRVCISKNYSL